jgi:putative spermidine/putrescine transport system permease protein
LTPSFVASFLLLFASGFSAFATAREMTVGNISLVPLIIGTLLDGNVTVNQFNLGYALAMGMIVVALLAMIPYLLIQARTSKWQR